MRCYLDELGPIIGPNDLIRDVPPPVSLGYSLRVAGIEVFVPDSVLGQFLIVSPEFYHDVFNRVVNALRPWKSQQGEFGVISLTDRAFSLVEFYHKSLGGVRNKRDSTTLGRMRADSIWYLHGIPICRIEEKEDSIEEAWEDLQNKMKDWSPAVYSDQPWILAIAATLSQVRFGYFQPEKGISRSWRLDILCTLVMDDLSNRFIFAGILLKFAKHLQGIQNQLLVRHCKLTEETSLKVSERHWIYLNGCHVIKEYAKRPSHLDMFYEDTRAIAGIEKMVASGSLSRKRKRGLVTSSASGNPFYYELTPVGLDVLPSDYPAAISTLIETVRKLHKLGWAHLDIRWQNVIFEPIGQVYVLIDCEFARRMGDNQPQQPLKCLEALPYIPTKVCPEIDWYSLGKMISFINQPRSSQLKSFEEVFLSMDMKKINSVFE